MFLHKLDTEVAERQETYPFKNIELLLELVCLRWRHCVLVNSH